MHNSQFLGCALIRSDVALHGQVAAIPKVMRERSRERSSTSLSLYGSEGRSNHNQFRLGMIVSKVNADYIGDVRCLIGERSHVSGGKKSGRE